MLTKFFNFISDYSTSYKVYLIVIVSGILYTLQSNPFLAYWAINSSLSALMLSLLWLIPFVLWHISLGLYLRIYYIKEKRISYFKFIVRVLTFHAGLLLCLVHPIVFPLLLFFFCLFSFAYIAWNFSFLNPVSDKTPLVKKSSLLSDPRKDKSR